MEQSVNFTQTLGRLKRERPFREFNIVMQDGRSFHVSGRFLFAHTESFVIVANEKKNGVVRLPLDTVVEISEADAN